MLPQALRCLLAASMQVFVRYKGGTARYAARISAVNPAATRGRDPTFDVHYDDGVDEHKVKARNIFWTAEAVAPVQALDLALREDVLGQSPPSENVQFENVDAAREHAVALLKAALPLKPIESQPDVAAFRIFVERVRPIVDFETLMVVCVFTGAAKGRDTPNFKGSYLGRFPLVSADFWTSDHPSERSRAVDACSSTHA